MKEQVNSPGAPAAIGPYSQALKVSSTEMLFCSGQIPLDAATGNLVGDTAEQQTGRIMENLKAVLEAAGYAMKDIVKTTIFLTDLAAFGEINKVYESFLSPPYPARSTVQVSALPRGAKVEIEAIACKA